MHKCMEGPMLLACIPRTTIRIGISFVGPHRSFRGHTRWGTDGYEGCRQVVETLYK